MTDKSMKIDEDFDNKGHFATGNTIGRMKKKGYTLLDLTKVAMQYDKTHDITILKHYIKQLLTDNRLLENFINKYVPTKTISELTGKDGSPLTETTILEKEIYIMCPLRLQCPIEKKVKEAERLRAIKDSKDKD